MRWTSSIATGWIAAANVALVWIVVCLLHIFEAFGVTDISSNIIIITTAAAIVLDLVIIAILIQARSRYHRFAYKLVIAGMFAFIVFAGALMVLWMPYAGYSWELTLMASCILFATCLVLVLRARYVRCCWYPMFCSRSHLHHNERLSVKMQSFE
jgi:hypothetical protein